MAACMTKLDLRIKLSYNPPIPLTRPSFLKICKRHQLHLVAGIEEIEFKNRQLQLFAIGGFIFY